MPGLPVIPNRAPTPVRACPEPAEGNPLVLRTLFHVCIALGYASTRLTRTPCASTLISNAFGYANVSCGTRARSRDVCFRLRRHDDARTGDAVLQFNALLVARPPWPGLLQNHAHDARFFCEAFACSRRVRSPRRVRGCSSVERIRWLKFLCSEPRRAMPRSAHLLLSGLRASSNLV